MLVQKKEYINKVLQKLKILGTNLRDDCTHNKIEKPKAVLQIRKIISSLHNFLANNNEMHKYALNVGIVRVLWDIFTVRGDGLNTDTIIEILQSFSVQYHKMTKTTGGYTFSICLSHVRLR